MDWFGPRVLNSLDSALCLRWSTERPFEGDGVGLRQSPTFLLYQQEFYLEMSLACGRRKRNSCYIDLHWSIPRKTSQNSLSVDCYLVARGKSFYESKFITVDNKLMEHILVSEIDEDDTSPSRKAEKWTVLVMFSGNQLPLQVNNKTYCFSVNKTNVDQSVQVSSEIPQDVEALSSDISGLLEEGILPDFKLECGGQTFPVHRSVLAARSEVFRAMLRNRMQESESGSADIKDLDVSVLESLLKFMYSGKLEDISEDTAEGMYEAADKYAVPSLRKACSYWLERNLSEGNCISYLSIAESHSDSHLRASVTSFIVQHPGRFNSSAWLTFSMQQPVLATTVFQTYFSLVSQL